MALTPAIRPSFRNVSAKSLKNLLDPGPHQYASYIFSGRTFYTPDVPGPRPVPDQQAFDDGFARGFQNPEHP